MHLSLEKIIKEHVCKNKNDLAPRIHNLVRLSGETSLTFEQRYTDVFAELNAFNIEGRYPDSTIIPVSQDEALDFLERAEEVFQWLINQL